MARFPPSRTPILVTAALLAWGLAPTGTRPAALLDDRIGRAEMDRIERGYYERVLDAGRRLDAPATSGSTPSSAATIPFNAGPLCNVVDDVREYELKPNLIKHIRGGRWSTNSFGMRDREYPRTKPPGTIRIALVGDSIGAGWGVDDDQTFEALLEKSLDGQVRAPVEVLNFAVPGHAPGQRWLDFTRHGWTFGIDLVIYEATPAEPSWDEHRLRGLLPRGLGWDCPLYREALATAGIRPGGDFERYKRDLRPLRWAILANVYRTIAADCRSRGVPVVWVLVPRVGRPADATERRQLVKLARESGFDATADLSDAYEGLDPSELAVAPDDYHPNPEGHARLADRIEAVLTARPDWRALAGGAAP